MAFDKNNPVESTSIVNASSIFTGNWDAIDTAFAREHYSFSSASSGLHVKGVAGVIRSGTSTAITGVSSPPTGALGWDETQGNAKVYTGSSWGIVNSIYSPSKVMAYRSTSQVFTSGTTKIGFNAELEDTMSEFSTSTSYFTPKASGLYLITGQVTVTAVLPTDYIALSVMSGGSGTSFVVIHEGNAYGDPLAFGIKCLLNLTTSSTIGLGVASYLGGSLTVSGGSTATYLHIHRMC